MRRKQTIKLMEISIKNTDELLNKVSATSIQLEIKLILAGIMGVSQACKCD